MAQDILAFKYRGTNLGDDIQTLAMMNLMGAPSHFIERDKLSLSEHSGKLVLGGWWGHAPDTCFPVPPSITPLPVSMHLNKGMQGCPATLSLAAHAPIGARDLYTRDFLLSQGIESYFSGCMTLTLPVSDLPRSDTVILCDLKPQEQAVALSFFPKAVCVTHGVHHLTEHPQRRDFASALLKFYRSAALVITSRLHAALPSIAMGTPAILCHRNPLDPRFTGYEDTLPICHPRELSAAITSHLSHPFERSAASIARSEALKTTIEAFRCS